MAEGGKDLNTKNWEMFLEPVKPVMVAKNNEIDDPSTEELYSQSNRTLPNFIGNLKSQELVHNEEKKDKLSQQRSEICEMSLLTKEAFDPLLKAFKQYNKVDSLKSDMKKSGSTWTLDMLTKYFFLVVDDFYTKQGVDDCEPQPNTNQEDRKELQNILISLGVITTSYFETCPFTTGLHCLAERLPLLRECSVRTILDSLLQSICRQARDEAAYFAIQLVHEFSIKSDSLPTNILDYGLLVNGLDLVGIVEAKTPRTMNQNAVAQLVIQLMSLLKKDPKSPHFGVLTDGYRFLFAYANEDGVYFENKYHDDGKVTVLVHEAGTWKDLDFIKIKILNLCRRVCCFQLNPKNVAPPPRGKESEYLMFTKAIAFEDSSLTNQTQEPQGQDNYASLPLHMQGLNIAGSYPPTYPPAQPTCPPTQPTCPPHSLHIPSHTAYMFSHTAYTSPARPTCPPTQPTHPPHGLHVPPHSLHVPPHSLHIPRTAYMSPHTAYISPPHSLHVPPHSLHIPRTAYICGLHHKPH